MNTILENIALGLGRVIGKFIILLAVFMPLRIVSYYPGVDSLLLYLVYVLFLLHEIGSAK